MPSPAGANNAALGDFAFEYGIRCDGRSVDKYFRFAEQFCRCNTKRIARLLNTIQYPFVELFRRGRGFECTNEFFTTSILVLGIAIVVSIVGSLVAVTRYLDA